MTGFGREHQFGVCEWCGQALVEMQLPCLDYFMAHFLDSFRLTLDELERFSGARGWVDVAKGWRDEELS